jgi:DNA-directed RNA polymerase subunit RPC12/RpoP
MGGGSEQAMITLEEHNRIRSATIADAQAPRLNGIACPKCGSELIDSNPGLTLTSSPPRFMVACQQCGYQGTRL